MSGSYMPSASVCQINRRAAKRRFAEVTHCGWTGCDLVGSGNGLETARVA